jgi:hypothetical protein
VSRAELGVSPEAVFIFIRFQTEFKLQKFVSKYSELQNYEISSVGFIISDLSSKII